MNFPKRAFSRIGSLLLIALLGGGFYLLIDDDKLILAVLNQTGYPISDFTLQHETQYCAVTHLRAGDQIQCTLSASGSMSISLRGKINGVSYSIEDIGGLEAGRHFRNFIQLKPNGNYAVTSKQVLH